MNMIRNIADLSIKSIRMVKKTSIILTVLISCCFSVSLYALEVGAEIHKGEDSKTTGFNLSISDNFSRKHNLNWTLAYNKLDDIKRIVTVDGNERDKFFSVDTIEALVSYQQKLRTYDSFLKNITFEFQAGLSAALTENKFIWKTLNQEQYFSEKGDVNAILTFSTHYHINKNSAIRLGLKYQPNFSEFGSVSSIYLGFSYKFGRQVGY